MWRERVGRRRGARALCCAVLLAAASVAGGEERLPGWQGETHSSSSTQLLRGQATGGEAAPEPWIEQLSWHPRAWLYHNFMSKEECEYLIQQAAPEMVKSAVVDNVSGQSLDSDIRTSSGMFLRRGQDATIRRIEERIAAFSMVPSDHGEGIQVLHYEEGQKYEAHFDYFHDQLNTQNGGQRVATVLMYLSDVAEGGETVFPSATDGTSPDKELSSCGQNGVAVKPRRGDALLFWSLTLDGNTDSTSLHAGCPVIKGEKWTATKWMRVGKITGV